MRAATSLISGQVSTVPWHTYQRKENGGRERAIGTREYGLLHDRANPQMTSAQLREAMTGTALLYGNSYAEIVTDAAGRPAALWPIAPWRVSPFVEPGSDGLSYRVHNPTSGADTVIDARRMFHLRGELGADGLLGLDLLARGREVLEAAVAVEQFGLKFYANDTSLGAVIEYPVGVSPTPQARKDNAEALRRGYKGVDRSHRLLALYEGAKFSRTTIEPERGQFLGTRQFLVAEIARLFNLPPHKIGDLSHASFSNIESQTREFATDCLAPWLGRWQSEAQLKILPASGALFSEFDLTALVRGDTLARGQFYQALTTCRAITPNEIRRLENLPPIAGGDDLPEEKTA